MVLSNEELIRVIGGASKGISTTLFNSIARLVTVLVDLGRTIGSSISRIKNKNYCN